MFLAVIMMITFVAPVYAAFPESPFDLGQAWEISDSGTTDTNTTLPESNETPPVEDEPLSKPEDQPAAASETEAAKDLDTEISAEPAATLGTSGELTEAELLAQMEQWINSLSLSGGNPRLRAAPGDTGTITHTTISIKPYDVTVPGVGRAYGSVIWRMKIKGEDAFCLQIWKLAGGTYTAGDATSGNGATAQYIANYMASDRLNTDYVAAQVLVWESLYGDIGIYNQSIQGTNYESAYHSLKNASASTSDLLYWTSSTGGQEVVTFATGTVDPQDPPEPPEDPPEEGDPVPPTETITTTDTRTEVRTDTTYEYSDAIGQITIAKRDDEGKSLDGAIFNIEIEFANGERGGDSAFEVYNGSRLFTYTHPRDDNEPAKITVTEVRSPTGFQGSSTPQTAIVHPTYTRVTKVTTTTITITTTTTTTTNIETGNVLAEVTQDAETALDPPMVQEYTDFVEGDRETTLTFINYPEPCSLTIYKYEKGNYGKSLEGARFRIRYADINVSAQVWELTTDSSGRIVIDPLPKAGTLVVEELQAPDGGYEIGEISTFTVTVAKGEQKRLDVSNDKRAQLIVYKKDAVSGQLLQGAVFKATLIGQGIVKTAESGSDGRALFTDLIPGEWRIEEQSPPPYFLPSSKVETIFIPDGSYQTLELTWENEPYSGLTIRKVSYQDGRGLKGAVFGLYRGSEANPLDFLGEFQTDDNGRIVIENLESNQYYTVIERQPPINHLLDEDNTRTILIKPDALENNITLIFRNKEKPKILIEKVDELGNPVPDCTFRVSRRDSAEYVEVTTGPTGTVLVEGLFEDWYQISEIRSADGFILSTEIKDVQLEAGKTSTLQFVNYRQPTLTIQKIDEKTGLGLDNAVIRVWREGVDEYQDYTTSGGGYIRLTNMDAGFVLLQEQRAPAGFQLSDEIHRIELKPGGNHEFTIKNKSLPKLTIRKIDEQTLEGIPGVTFRLTKDGEFRDVTTGANGIITAQLSPGWWTYVETSVPNKWILDPTPGYVELVAGQDKEIVVKNRHKPSLKIIKLDALTRQPMEGVSFEISVKNGAPLGTYKTDVNGEILLVDIEPNTLLIKELPFDGYLALTPEKEVIVDWGKLVTVEFQNQPKNPIVIKKINSVTGEPISGALFHISKVDGTFIGEYRTGRNGFITVTGLEPGFFQIRERQPAPGFILDETMKIVELKYNAVAEVEFLNRPLNGIEIYKIDSKTREPLEGAEFTVKKKSGELVGVYKTSVSGRIEIPDLEPGWYSVYESATSSPEYLLDATVRDVELKWNDYVLLEFVNTKYSGLQVRKVDSVTKEPLQGIKFRVTKLSGDIVGDFVTGPGGFFTVDGLEPNTYYTCFETATIPGYILDQTPQTFKVKKDESLVLEYENKPLSGLQIRKTDAVTGLPLAGVEFKVTELDGRLVGNYTTPESGIIFIENLKPGYFVVQEIKGLPTHKLDTAPRNVLVETGKLNVVEYRNQPYPVLEIQKIDSDTKQPLEGVRFRLMDRYQREIGIFTTSSLGKIILTGMDEGTYFLQECEAKFGYQLDSSVREIRLAYGKTTTIEIRNTPLSTLRVKKVDKLTGQPLAGVVFLLRDSKHNIIGEYKTNNSGLIDLPRSLPHGKYFLEEKSALPNYVNDKTLYEIELRSGQTTELTIENQPYRGKIQLIKKAAENSSITKQKKGALLEGAVFEIYNSKLEVVDRITTNERGIANSKDLPVGVYGIKEISAPQYFYTTGEMFYAEIKNHDDLIRFEVLNSPEDISVSVEKRGNVQAMPNDTIRYDFSNISNTSNIPLEDFYWHDLIPTDAVRLSQIHTGTWSEKLTYKVMYRTNLKTTYRVLEDKLSTTVDNVLECGREALRLAANEYITDIKFEFGTVDPGFTSVDNPYMYVTVLGNLPDGYQFTNRTTVGGRTGDEWIYSKDAWTTCIFAPPRGSLPRTGY